MNKCDCETIAGMKAHTMECVFGPKTTPTTPSEWGELDKEFESLWVFSTQQGMRGPYSDDQFRGPQIETASFIKKEDARIVFDRLKTHATSLIHHNTEDIIEQCAKEAEEWLDDTEADETVKAILRVVAKQIRALKPTHKE